MPNHTKRRLLAVALALLLPASTTLRAQVTRMVYRSPTDTLAYGYKLFLPAGQPRGLVVIGANYGNTYVDLEYQQAQIGALLQARGVASIHVNNTPWRNNYFNSSVLAAYDTIIGTVMSEHRIPAGRVILGGMMMGGTFALKYAQRCAEGACPAENVPRGVFALDPILDFTRFWRAYEVYLRRPGGAPRTRALVKGSIERELGGTPDQLPEVYASNSVYVHFDVNGGRAALLRNTPVRLYMEPDVLWYMNNFDDDLITSNAADIAGLALFLRRIGNTRAELITPSGRSLLPDGRPSPHAWRMIDEPALVEWIVALLGAGG
jgi:hypothetical protein